MRLVVTSCTHGFERGMPLPGGDVLVHCGDYSRDFGSWMDTVRFAGWMQRQPHKHKILCPGNHDYAVYENPAKAALLFKHHGIHMIGVDRIVIDDVVFDGGPAMPVSGWDPPWGFETDEDERQRLWSRIGRVDVLVTHTPPLGILDKKKGESLGCGSLRTRVLETIRPRLHCFGHVHEARGVLREDGITFMNACSNSRGTFVRDDTNGITHLSVTIRDAFTYDIEEPHD